MPTEKSFGGSSEAYKNYIHHQLDEATWLTDDPLNSCKTLMQLSSGDEVTCLATMGEWLYVETTLSGKTVRGFIPVAAAAPVEPAQGWDVLNPNG